MARVTFPIAVCTCARAHPISLYQKRLDRSSSNLVCSWKPIGYEAFTCHGPHFTLRSARAHVHTSYLHLRNGLADCAQICCAFETQSAVTQSVCAVGGWRVGQFARLAVCAVGGLRSWRFARLAVCAVGGLRGWRLRCWRFARLAVCAVGCLRGGRFARLAVCAVGGLRGWRFARLAVCAVGGLHGWRFARFAFGDWRFAFDGWRLAVCVWRFAICALQFAVGGLRLTIGGLRFVLDVVVLQLSFAVALKIPFQ